MSDNYESTGTSNFSVRIKVIGVGSGGINAVRGMLFKSEFVEFLAIDTDIKTLEQTPIPNRLTCGDKSEWREAIAHTIEGADLVFIVAGMGGENGLDAMLEVAKVSKEIIGALTVAVVTRPFTFEGTERCNRATVGIEQLVSQVDTLVTISNDKLLVESEDSISIQAAFTLADNIMQSAVRCISDTLLITGVIMVDFADVRSVLADTGFAYFGIGVGKGDPESQYIAAGVSYLSESERESQHSDPRKSRARDAALQAINSPLLECSIENARNIITNITGGHDATLAELCGIVPHLIYEAVDPNLDLNVSQISGVQVCESMQGKIQVSMIVTGFVDRV